MRPQDLAWRSLRLSELATVMYFLDPLEVDVDRNTRMRGIVDRRRITRGVLSRRRDPRHLVRTKAAVSSCRLDIHDETRWIQSGVTGDQHSHHGTISFDLEVVNRPRCEQFQLYSLLLVRLPEEALREPGERGDLVIAVSRNPWGKRAIHLRAQEALIWSPRREGPDGRSGHPSDMCPRRVDPVDRQAADHELSYREPRTKLEVRSGKSVFQRLPVLAREEDPASVQGLRVEPVSSWLISATEHTAQAQECVVALALEPDDAKIDCIESGGCSDPVRNLEEVREGRAHTRENVPPMVRPTDRARCGSERIRGSPDAQALRWQMRLRRPRPALGWMCNILGPALVHRWVLANARRPGESASSESGASCAGAPLGSPAVRAPTTAALRPGRVLHSSERPGARARRSGSEEAASPRRASSRKHQCPRSQHPGASGRQRVPGPRARRPQDRGAGGS